MSTGTVARRLIELCRAGQFNRAIDELYAEDARGMDPEANDSSPLGSIQGLAAIRRRKGKVLAKDYVKVHSVLVSDPLIAGPFFTIAMGVDATYEDGARRAMNEVCVFEVRDGKIVRQQLFAASPRPPQ